MCPENPYAAPKISDPPQVEATRDTAIWRSGKLLVVGRDQVLPDRCVLCNAPAVGVPYHKSLTWSTALTFLGVALGVLPLSLTSFASGDKFMVTLGLCRRHSERRQIAKVVGWVGALFSLLLFARSYVDLDGERNLWVLSAFAVFLFSVMFGMTRSRTVWLDSLDDDLAWVKGVCPQYLDRLPEYRPPAK